MSTLEPGPLSGHLRRSSFEAAQDHVLASAEDDPLGTARAALLSRIGGETLVEVAVRRLGEAIGLGLLEVGERLPPEAELAERLGLATMTLREALAILRRAGYLETRRGRGGGTFVRRAVPPPTSAEARHRLERLTVDHLRDLCEFRVVIEGAAAARAAERAGDAEFAELRSLVRRMDRPRSYAEFRRADSRFHLLLASAARSPHLAAAEASIQSELRDLLALIPHPAAALRVSNGQHATITEAIALRDAHLARSATERHVVGTGDFLIGLRLGKLGGR